MSNTLRPFRLAGAGAARALLTRLSFNVRCELFRILARTLKVEEAWFGDMCCPVQDRVVWPVHLHDGYSLEIVELVVRELNRLGPGCEFLDVGANVGMIAVPVARACPGNFVRALEPVPATFRCLWLNGLNQPRFVAYNLAAAAREGSLSMSLSPETPGDNRVTSGGQPPGWRTVETRCTALDTFYQRGVHYVLKVDVQGAECGVFLGGPRVLGATSLLLFEFWPYGLRKFDHDALGCLEAVLRHFRTGWVSPPGGPRGEVVSREELRRVLTRFYTTHRGLHQHLDVVLRK